MSTPMTSTPESPESPEPGADEPEDKKSSRTRSIIEWVVVIGARARSSPCSSRRSWSRRSTSRPSRWCPPSKIGDRVLVNKLSYDLHDVNRGDLVVFERPPGETDESVKDLIKRVVGLAGRPDRHQGQLRLHQRRAARRELLAGRNAHQTGSARLRGRDAVRRPRRLDLGDGRQPRALLRQSLLRADRTGHDRRSRLLAHLAARPVSASCSAPSARPRVPRDRGHHAVDVIAEHPVHTRVEHLVEHPLELAVPGEGERPRSGGTARRGRRSSRCGAGSRRRSRPSASSAARRSAPSFMCRSRVESTSCDGRAERPARSRPCRQSGWHSHSRASASEPASRATRTTSPAAASSLMSSESSKSVPQVSYSSAKGRDVGGSSARVDRRDRPAPQPSAHHPVVVEHRLAVGGEPHIALEAGGPQAQRQLEGLQRVLRRVGPSAPVGETNGLIAQGRASVASEESSPCGRVRASRPRCVR